MFVVVLSFAAFIAKYPVYDNMQGLIKKRHNLFCDHPRYHSLIG